FQGFDRAATERTASPPVLTSGVNIVNKTLEQVHLIMGFPGLHHSAPERYALFLLNDIIGGSMSSRLFQEVREREGLVYAIHSGVQAYVDTGTLYVYAATDEKNFSKVLKSTLKVLRELKKTGVTEEELRRAKDHLKGSLMLSLESTSSRMNRLAKHEMHHGTFLLMDAMPCSNGVRIQFRWRGGPAMKRFVLVIVLGVLALTEALAQRFVVNGQVMGPQELAILDRFACQYVPNGYYWLNTQTGLWGYAGNP